MYQTALFYDQLFQSVLPKALLCFVYHFLLCFSIINPGIPTSYPFSMCLFVCSKEWCFHSCTTHIQTTLSLLVTAVPVTVSYRCTNSGHQFTQVTKFCVVVPYVCGASMRNMFDVTLLPPEILRRLLNFLKNLCKSSVSNKIFSSNRLYR